MFLVTVLGQFLLAFAFICATPIANSRQTQDTRIKTWPKPKYPPLASWLRWDGYCEVRFAVDEQGFPFAVEPSCSRKIFCFDAKRAVTASTFYPQLVDGVPTARINVVYPLQYSFNFDQFDEEALKQKLERCEERAVS
ncbi:MAG: energy transducer TonB [Pseudomonadota bacterium]